MVTRVSRKVTKAGNDASSDPPSDNGNHTESGFFGNGSDRGRNVNEMVQLNTVDNGVAHADVCKVHAGGYCKLIPGLVS